MAWIGAIVGLVGAGLSDSSSKSASGASENATEMALGFKVKQYNDWRNIYGSIQDNLAKYYADMTPDRYIAQNLETYNKQSTQQLDKVRATLAARGISDSGLAGSVETQFALNNATAEAQIREEAPQKVAEQKLKFLSVGMGNDPTNSLGNSLDANARNLSAIAQQASQASGQATSDAVYGIGTALQDYMAGAEGRKDDARRQQMHDDSLSNVLGAQ